MNARTIYDFPDGLSMEAWYWIDKEDGYEVGWLEAWWGPDGVESVRLTAGGCSRHNSVIRALAMQEMEPEIGLDYLKEHGRYFLAESVPPEEPEVDDGPDYGVIEEPRPDDLR